MSSVLRLVFSMASTHVGIVPGVDLAGPRDVDRLGVVLVDLGDERAVRPVGDRGRGEGRNLGEAGHLRQRGHVGAKRRLVDVPDQLEQPALVVDQQHDGVVGVDHPLVDFGHDLPPLLINVPKRDTMYPADELHGRTRHAGLSPPIFCFAVKSVTAIPLQPVSRPTPRRSALRQAGQADDRGHRCAHQEAHGDDRRRDLGRGHRLHEAQQAASKPFFCLFNGTRMHLRTHVRAEHRGRYTHADSEYADGMLEL